jgi:hypothetical protein
LTWRILCQYVENHSSFIFPLWMPNSQVDAGFFKLISQSVSFNCIV